MKMFVQRLYANKLKARNPGNTIASQKEEAGCC